MSKKTLADWWEETHLADDEEQSETGGRRNRLEALYEQLGNEPAVENSLEILRKEMAAVYRDMRCGRIDCDDGSRLAYVLDLVRKSHDSSAMREKLGALGKAMGVKPEGKPGWLGLPFDDAD